MTKVVPVGSNVLIKQDKGENKTKGGLHLPDQSVKLPGTGVVLAVGKDVEECQEGDGVVFNKYDIRTVEVEEQDWAVIEEDKILVRVVD